MNRWRILGAILIVMALLVMLIPAAEADAESSASNFTISGGELVKYKGSERTVTVPNTVTSIGEGAFENNTTVEKIILPDSVEKIGAYAFWGCDNLKSVTLGKGLSAVDDFAFTNCTGLSAMTIPENIHSIGIQAFSGCRNLEDITIPYQVVDIRDDAFDGDYLLNIHCEEGSYADRYAKAFYERQKNMPVYNNSDNSASGGTDSQTESGSAIVIPSGSADGVYSGAEIQAQVDAQNGTTASGEPSLPTDQLGGTSAVVGNEAVVFFQQIGIPVVGDSSGVASAEVVSGTDRLNEIATEQEKQRQSAQTVATQPEVTADGKIAERAHYRDSAYSELVLDSSVNGIGQFAYARSGLREAVIPVGIEKIGYAAFYHCDDLAKVEIPDSVTSVEAKAFAHTPWVEQFQEGRREGEEDSDFLISGGVLVAYRGDGAEVTVPEGVRVIAGEAFADHEEITKIILPSTLQTIDDRAFAGCRLMDVEYTGDTLSKELLEETVSVQTLSGTPETGNKRIPIYAWILAGIFLIGGCLCIFKERY